jgi:hypothetical protein
LADAADDWTEAAVTKRATLTEETHQAAAGSGAIRSG